MLGVYGLWVLFMKDTERVFNAGQHAEVLWADSRVRRDVLRLT